MESNRAVLGIPGDGRSGMSICIVVHVMKAACFCGLLAALFRGLTVVLHQQECIQIDVDH